MPPRNSDYAVTTLEQTAVVRSSGPPTLAITLSVADTSQCLDSFPLCAFQARERTQALRVVVTCPTRYFRISMDDTFAFLWLVHSHFYGWYNRIAMDESTCIRATRGPPTYAIYAYLFHAFFSPYIASYTKGKNWQRRSRA